MNRSPLHDFLVTVPKCEHHCHMEGTLTPDLLFQLAARNNITLPGNDPSFESPKSLLSRYGRFTSLDDFLHYYFIGMSCLIQAQDFEDLAWAYFQKANEQGVVHAEVFFDPQAHTARGVKFDTFVTGFETACARARNELDISTLLIPCFLRHLPLHDSQSMLGEALPHLQSGKLAGIGLSGSEKAFPPSPWGSIYKEAKKYGIRRTAHAGEEGPVDYIKQGLRSCDIQRIDHGIKLADDDALMKEVAESKVLVTMCPLSNLKLQCVKSVEELPIRKFLDAGVQFSINSDDPAYFTSYILDNYLAVQDAFELSTEDWIVILEAAVNGSWCDEERKMEIRQATQEAVQSYLQR